MKIKRRRGFIITCIIAGVIVYALICFIGHQMLENRIDRRYTEAICAEIEDHMINDLQFEASYGKVVSATPDTVHKRQIIDHDTNHVACIVTTETGKSYLVWVRCDYSGESKAFTYISVELVTVST